MLWKRWILKLVLSFTIGFVLLVVAVNGLIDPYWEWNFVRASHNAHRYFQDHETAAFQMARRLEKSDYSLVFGTSHSATISEEALGSPLLNLSVSVYGNPIDVFYFLKGLSPEAWSHIKHVYFDLDHHTFNDIQSQYEKTDFYSPWQYLKRTLTDIDLTKVQRSWYTLQHNLGKPAASELRDNGEFVYSVETTFTPGPESENFKLSFAQNKSAMDSLGKVDHLLASHQVPVTYFNTVFSRAFLRKVNLDSVKSQYEAILSQIPEFTSLIYLKEYSDDNRWFRDETHHKFVVTLKEMEILKDPVQREAHTLQKKDITGYFEKLDRALGN